jgi:HEAT repeat protein
LFIFRDFREKTEGIPPIRLAVGSVKKLKDRIAKCLASKSGAVNAAAALTLAIAGDQGYIPQIAAFLDVMDVQSDIGDDEETGEADVEVRGNAAMALGVLGAKEYAPRLLTMIENGNAYDRCGAMLGLAYLNEPSYAVRISSAFVVRKDSKVNANQVNECAIKALHVMGIGKP